MAESKNETVLKLFPFNNQYISLGDSFYDRIDPSPVTNPTLIQFNVGLADSMGLPAAYLNSNMGAEIFSGNVIPDGAEPLAMVYAGHQFGNFVSQLGDGRAILLGEIADVNGKCYEIQLKGSGRTFYSRNGDGRAALGPVLREYIVSEAMEKLGVPTTRALAVVSTGEEVARERLLPGGIITRVASSFVRVGTFEYFAARGDVNAIQKLADHVIARHYPEVGDETHSYRAMLQAIVDRQASLIAQWMQIGFIHGVMNTDNMSIAGETIDYGPCAYMDTFDHHQVYSSIDYQGRYAYGNQPSIGLWNLTRLAESLVPLLADNTDEAVEHAKMILESYIDHYEDAWLDGMRAKCGLLNTGSKTNIEDKALIDDFLNIMARNDADFTLTFYYLSQLEAQSSEEDRNLEVMFEDTKQIRDWLSRWRLRLNDETMTDEERQAHMQAVNPIYIPRNHQVEAAIRAAEDHDDLSVFYELHAVLENPYTRQDGKDYYMRSPEPDEVVKETFCGT